VLLDGRLDDADAGAVRGGCLHGDGRLMRAIYAADSEGVVAVAAASTKTVFGVKADAGHAIDLLFLFFSIDQATPTATDKAVFVEFCAITFATNAPGTNSTAVTIDSYAGPRVAETFAGGKNWTAEPTVVTALDPFDADPYKFTYREGFPLGESPDFAAAEGFGIRVTNPSGNQSVNVRAGARWARV
jgi:hypothetical protein